MNYGTQKLFAWSGVAFIALFGLGFAIAGFIPPSPSPGDSANEMAQLFRDDKNRIRVGLVVMMYASALLGTWAIAISLQLRRIEGRDSPLTWAQVLLGCLFVLEFIVPVMILQAATFRTERSDESIQSMIDISWLMFMGVDSTVLLQGLVIGAVILRDKRVNPIYPRWSGYFSIWAVTIVQPGAVIVFFKEGPFTWNGLFVWWVPIFAFAPWVLVFAALTLRAITRQEQDADSGHGDSALGYGATLSVDAFAELRAEVARLTVLTERQVSTVSATTSPPIRP